MKRRYNWNSSAGGHKTCYSLLDEALRGTKRRTWYQWWQDFQLNLKLNGERIANYERGWDLKPATEKADIALRILHNVYN